MKTNNISKKQLISIVIIMSLIVVISKRLFATLDKFIQHNLVDSTSIEEIAITDAGYSSDDVIMLENRLNKDKGIYVYDVIFVCDDTEYKYSLRATDGYILSKQLSESNLIPVIGAINIFKEETTEKDYKDQETLQQSAPTQTDNSKTEETTISSTPTPKQTNTQAISNSQKSKTYSSQGQAVTSPQNQTIQQPTPTSQPSPSQQQVSQTKNEYEHDYDDDDDDNDNDEDDDNDDDDWKIGGD